MTKLRIISDVHNEWEELELTPLKTDRETILIITGDIDTRGRAALSKTVRLKGNVNKVTPSFLDRIGERFLYVIVVLGNHDHWGYSIDLSVDKMKSQLTSNNVYILENEVFIYENIKFIGSTLWTDFDRSNPVLMNDARFSMVDYKKIRCNNHTRKITPVDIVEINIKSKRFIKDELLKDWDGDIVLVTHHAPSYQFVADEFKGDSLNGCYYNSDLDNVIYNTGNLKLWVHGHVHTSLDNTLGNCRILCNPRGYSPEYLNPDFNEMLLIDTDDFQ